MFLAREKERKIKFETQDDFIDKFIWDKSIAT